MRVKVCLRSNNRKPRMSQLGQTLGIRPSRHKVRFTRNDRNFANAHPITG